MRVKKLKMLKQVATTILSAAVVVTGIPYTDSIAYATEVIEEEAVFETEEASEEASIQESTDGEELQEQSLTGETEVTETSENVETQTTEVVETEVTETEIAEQTTETIETETTEVVETEAIETEIAEQTTDTAETEMTEQSTEVAESETIETETIEIETTEEQTEQISVPVPEVNTNTYTASENEDISVQSVSTLETDYEVTEPLTQTAEGVYSIDNKAQFITFLASDEYKSATINLNCDIDMKGELTYYGRSFSGVFNGNGHSIDNAQIEQGIFQYIDTKGQVKNLHISNVTTTGDADCGVLATNNRGTISYCVVTGNLNSTENRRITGGIAGTNSGTLSNCAFAGNITATVETAGAGKYIGGIAGVNTGTIENCYALGTIDTNAGVVAGIVADNSNVIKGCANYMTVSGAEVTGGITAQNRSGEITDCYNYGAVNQKDASSGGQAGGIAANHTGSIANCYNYADITGNSYNIAGIAGYSAGDISTSGNYGTITGFANVGGIAGLNCAEATKNINDCFNHGLIKGIGNNDEAIGIGGILGSSAEEHSVSINNCYNTGNIQGSINTKYIGGIAGILYKGAVSNSYNAGSFTSAENSYTAMIAGFLGEKESASYANCLFLDGGNDAVEYICYRESGDVSDDTAKKSQDDLKAAAELLGEGFTADSNSINSGYPVLKNQTAAKYTYPVVYELNGGCLDRYFELVEKNQLPSQPSAPFKKHANFLGWFADAEGKTAYDFSKGISAATIIYADWESYTAVEDMELALDKITLVKNESYKIKVNFTPQDAKNTALIWNSENTAVATVDETGLVTALEAGTAKITAKMKDESLSKVLSFTVNVTTDDNVVRIKDYEQNIEISELDVAVNDPKIIEAVFGKTPSDSATITWSTNKPEIAKVTQNSNVVSGTQATVEGIKPGVAKITVCMTENDKAYTETIEVTVLPLATDVFIKLGEENVNDKTVIFDLVTKQFIAIGTNKLDTPTDTFEAVVSPSEASQKVTWKSEGTSIIRFEDEKSGKASGNTAGTTTVTATAIDGSGTKGTATVTTKRIVQALSLVPAEVNKETPVVKDEYGRVILTSGNSVKLLTEFTPVDVTDERVKWTISDKNALEIDAKTKIVTAKKVVEDTKVTVTATSFDEGGASCEIVFVIKPLVEKIEIYKTTDMKHSVNDAKIGINPENASEMQFSLVARNYPENASQMVTWKSANTKVAEVEDNKDGSCNVTIKGKGTALITATAADGSKVTAVTTINVSSLATEIVVTGGDMVMKGKSITLKAEVYPKSATNKEVTWESLMPEIATVGEASGTVTGVKAGMAVIIATAADGSGISTPHTVKVTDKIETFDIMLPDYNDNTEDDVIMTNKSVGIDPDVGSGTYVVAARVLPKTACQLVEWKSSNEKVATVENGVITAVGLGEAKIIARATDGSGKSASVNLFVTTLVKNISISGSHYVGAKKSIQLTAEVGDRDAANKEVIWSSEHDDIAIVDETGKVTAIAKTGEVIITAEAADGSGVKAEHKVFVMGKPNDIDILSYDNDCTIETDKSDKKKLKVDMSKNESIRFTAEISGGSEGNPDYPKQIEWYVSDSKLAKVETELAGDDEVVRVTFLDEGTVTLTAMAADGTEAKDTCTIKVENTNPKVEITGPSQVAKGKKIKLSTGNTDVTWKTSDDSIATVNSKGQVTGKSIGSVEITAEAKHGYNTDTYTIYVEKPVSKVYIYNNNKDVTKQNIGFDLVKSYTAQELDLEAVVDGADDNSVTWKSSKPSVVAVDEAGKLEIKGSGKATITATATDGSGKKAKVTITIAKQVTEIVPEDGNYDINVAYKKSVQLNLKYKPLTATTKKVTWTSSHPKVVAVNKTSGKITAKKSNTSSAYPQEGYVTITATAADNGGTICEFRVYVTTPVNKVEIVKQGQEYSAIVGVELDSEPVNLSANLFDKNKENVADQKVIWKSSNTKIAEVDSNGVVTGISTGKATITATTTDGTKKSGKITVYVGKLVNSIVLDSEIAAEEGIILRKGKSINISNKLTVYPLTATNQELKYTTSKKKVATVNAKGKITAKKEGEAYITISAKDGSGVEKVIKVTVVR